MTNLVLLSIQLVTNDVSYTHQWHISFPSNVNNKIKWTTSTTSQLFEKKEVWQLYTIGYQEQIIHVGSTNDPMVFYQFNGPKFFMLTLSNMIGTLEPKQETNWVFTPITK